ncbi:MAG: CorA family divalent cation transporter [Candidatus Berkiella sp.]
MITNIYISPSGALTQNPEHGTLAWIDICNPTPEQRKSVERDMQITLPQRSELLQLEFSNRFYVENGCIFMSVNLITKVEPLPDSHMITLIVTPKAILTLRYSNPNPIQLLIDQLEQRRIEVKDYLYVIVVLLETFVGKVADIFELVGERSDQVVASLVKAINSKMSKSHSESLTNMLREINSLENLLSRGYQSLSSINLLVGFYEQNDNEHQESYVINNIDIVKKDVHSLLKHGEYLSQKLGFHLQSTLGLINIEQTQIVKMFTVLAMVFLPPTLIASVYGMNFHNMPELNWKYGYLLAILLMIASTFLPYKFFKKKGWI